MPGDSAVYKSARFRCSAQGSDIILRWDKDAAAKDTNYIKGANMIRVLINV